jgi:hypothetical protein
VDDQTKLFTLLIDIHDKIGTVRSDISKIEADIREHIRRTAIAEARIEAAERELSSKIATLQKGHYMVQGALALITLIGVIAGIYSHLSH